MTIDAFLNRQIPASPAARAERSRRENVYTSVNTRRSRHQKQRQEPGRRNGTSSVRPGSSFPRDIWTSRFSRVQKAAVQIQQRKNASRCKRIKILYLPEDIFSLCCWWPRFILEEGYYMLVCRRDGGEGNKGFYCSLLNLKLTFRINIWWNV